MAKCPYCEESLSVVDIEAVTLQAANLSAFSGLIYSCPNCNKALSVGVDLKVQQDRIADAVVEAMRRA
jgi:uncharacterized protein with PIN domain